MRFHVTNKVETVGKELFIRHKREIKLVQLSVILEHEVSAHVMYLLEQKCFSLLVNQFKDCCDLLGSFFKLSLRVSYFFVLLEY